MTRYKQKSTHRTDVKDFEGIVDFVDVLGRSNAVCEERSDGPAHEHDCCPEERADFCGVSKRRDMCMRTFSGV